MIDGVEDGVLHDTISGVKFSRSYDPQSHSSPITEI